MFGRERGGKMFGGMTGKKRPSLLSASPFQIPHSFNPLISQNVSLHTRFIAISLFDDYFLSSLHTYTRSHTHTHTLGLKHTHTHTFSHPLSLFFTKNTFVQTSSFSIQTLIHTFFLSISLSLSHTHTHTHTQTHNLCVSENHRPLGNFFR